MNSSGIWHILPFPPASEGRSPNLFCMYWWFCSLGPRILVLQLLCMCVETRGGEGLAQCRRILWGDVVQGVLQGGAAVDAFGSCAATLPRVSSEPSTTVHPCLFTLATSTAPPKSWLMITSLWYTLTSTFRAHLTLWAHPKCRPRSSAGPSLLIAVEIFRSSVDFFFKLIFAVGKNAVLPSSFHRNMVTKNSRQPEESGWQCKL